MNSFKRSKTRATIYRCSVAAVLVVALLATPQTASAACCTYDTVDCTDPDAHPEPQCQTGEKKSNGEVDNIFTCYSSGLIWINPSNPLLWAAAVALARKHCRESADGTCDPDDRSDFTEEPNGIDDNCDGEYLGDELCNGQDDDSDGLIDEDEGSCTLRILYAPFCWSGSQADFEDKAQQQVDFFLSVSGLNNCDHKYYFEFADKGDLNLTCQGSPNADGNYRHISPSAATLTTEISDSGLYNLKNFDAFVALTDQDFYEHAKGAVPAIGDARIWAEAEHSNTAVILAHEFGHAIRLSDEYCSTEAGGAYSCNDPDRSENPLDPNLGCDPTQEDCCSVDFRSPDRPDSDFYDDTPCGGIYSLCCLGNLALDVPANYTEGDPEPEMNTDGGRCIMSNLDAEHPRGWCERCWDHWNSSVGYPCSKIFRGVQRRLDTYGYVNLHGNIFVDGMSEGLGRGNVSAISSTGDYLVKIYDVYNDLIKSFGASFDEIALTSSEHRAEFWLRSPIAHVINGLPYAMKVYQDGVLKSKLTLNGQPAVTIADDIVEECTSPDGAPVTLDASASYDPNGDTIHFIWDAGDVFLFLYNSANPIGTFPIGDTNVALRVEDGTHAGENETVRVTVEDTTPPEIDNSPITYDVCIPNSAVIELEQPEITDVCTAEDSIEIETYIKYIKGIDVGMIPVTDGTVTFSEGEHVIEWVATDIYGNEARAEQIVTVVLNPGIECCESWQTVLEGTDGIDAFYEGGGPKCILGYGGGDSIITYDSGNDYVAGGNGGGGDFMYTRGFSVVVGERDDDFMNFHCGSSAYGYYGGDHMSCSGSGSALVYGGFGDDHIVTYGGNDIINAGPGVDDVDTGAGDDEVYVFDACELESGELMEGGAGYDILYLPAGVTEFDLIGLGIMYNGFEEIIELDAMQRIYSDCV